MCSVFTDDELGMEIKSVDDASLLCVALNSYLLHSARSFNIKNKPLPVAANAPGDLAMLSRLHDSSGNIKLLPSFIRNKEDLVPLRRLQPQMAIIPKIETVVSDTHLQEILLSCDAMMLGRGDLSLSCPAEELFIYQENIIGLCRSLQKQCIIATGLLTGISNKSGPSIAAAMDFGYLRCKGINGFLITGSNASNYPVETLDFMARFR
jgi:pyruvate kinase